MEHNFKKKFGQNFISDKNLISKIVNSIDLKDDDLVIEVGPGSGNMTEMISEKCHVLAYEIDLDLKPILESKLDLNKVDLIFDDFMNRDIQEDISSYNYSNLYVIANLPYYITTPIIEKITNSKLNINEIVIMVQKEVGDRLSAKPGTKDYSSLSVYLGYYYDINKIINVSRKLFYPEPNVDSVVVSLRKKEKIEFLKNEDMFFKLIRDSFQFKRKNIKNNLKNYDLSIIESILNKYNYDLSVRAECLPLEIFIDIANNL